MKIRILYENWWCMPLEHRPKSRLILRFGIIVRCGAQIDACLVGQTIACVHTGIHEMCAMHSFIFHSWYGFVVCVVFDSGDFCFCFFCRQIKEWNFGFVRTHTELIVYHPHSHCSYLKVYLISNLRIFWMKLRSMLRFLFLLNIRVNPSHTANSFALEIPSKFGIIYKMILKHTYNWI